jgi:uncharacterized damage-inducible protein DinB
MVIGNRMRGIEMNASENKITTLHGAPGPTLEILLDDPEEHDFVCAERALEGLSGEVACRRPPGLPFSIAEIVAHLLSNARFNLGLVDNPDPTTYKPPLPNWPAVRADDWERLRLEYLSVLKELKEVAQEGTKLDRIVYPASEDEPAWTVGYKLTCSVSKHATYHTGQIILIRRLLGAWGK